MTVDERVADWLERTTPEPPHPIAVADIAPRVPHRRRPWLPLLAAACVVTLAIAVVELTTRHDHPAATPQTTSWRFTRVAGDYPIEYQPRLFGDSRQIFAYQYSPAGQHDAIERFNPATGAVVARKEFHGAQLVNAATVTTSYVVVPMSTGRSIRIYLLDRRTLTVRAQLPPVDFRSGQDVVVAAAGDTAYLGIGRRVTEFDLAAREYVAGIAVRAGKVSALDLFRGTLYMGTTRGDLTMRRPNQGTASLPQHFDGQINGIVATAGGLWVQGVSRAGGDTVTFNGRAISGYFSLTRSAGTVWLNSDKLLACADPTTGRLRASSGQPRGSVLGLVVATPDHVLADGWKRHAPDTYIVELHPPAACR